jgi:hypothetical protein
LKLEIYNYKGQKIDELFNLMESNLLDFMRHNGMLTSLPVYTFYRIEAVPDANSGESFVEIQKMTLTR